MARLARLSLAAHVHHVVQRGNNGQPIFQAQDDYRFMLALLHEAAQTHQVAIHAYVLTAQQFHLLLTPKTGEGVPKMMQAVGRRYVRYFNDRYQRTGTLWDGRYRSTLIQAESYVLPCMVFMDWRPVHAGEAAQPADHAWSSHGYYAGLRPDRLVTPHPGYWTLGNTPFAREVAYAAMVSAGLHPDLEQRLRDAAHAAWALGDAGFLADLQRQTPRRVSKSRPGRPSRASTPV